MKTIAIVNQKGGSGKTTTASLLCKALVHSGKKVLAIDADPQATLTKLLKVKVQKNLFSCLTGMAELKQSVYRVEGLCLIPASIELSRIFTSTSKQEISRLLSRVKGCEYAIIDTPPNLEGLTLSSIQASNLVIVSCEVSRPALPATLYTIETLRKLKKKYKVLIVGYNDPKEDSKAYTNMLMIDYQKAIKDFVSIPKNIGTAKQAETAKPSKTSIENLYPTLRGLVV